MTDRAAGTPGRSKGPPAAQSREQQHERRVGRLLSALVLLVVVVVGVPEVWQRLSTGGLGLELFFYPLLGAAFLVLLLGRR